MLKVDHDREVVAGLHLRHVVAVLAPQYLFCAMLHKIPEALYLQRQEDLGLGFRSGDVERDAIKVGDGLVDGCGRGTV